MSEIARRRWRSFFLWAVLIALFLAVYRATLVSHEFFGAMKLDAYGRPAKLLRGVVVGLFDLFAISAVLLVVDRLSEGRHASNVLSGMRILASAAILSAPVIVIVVVLTRQLGLQPLFTVGPSTGVLALGGSLLAWFAWEDLVSYWFHRAMHASPTLWRFHQVHHSVKELNAFNNYEHVGEIVLRSALVTAPVSLLVALPVEYLFLANWLVSARSQYIHSSSAALRLPRSLRSILVDNAYHHVHHGRDERHYNKNFATLFPFIDRLFGTQQFPDDEFCQTGVHGVEPPLGIRSYLAAPWLTPQGEALPAAAVPSSPALS